MYEELIVKLVIWICSSYFGPRIARAISPGLAVPLRGAAALFFSGFSLLFALSYLFDYLYWRFCEPIAFFHLPISPILLTGNFPVDYIFFPVFLFTLWLGGRGHGFESRAVHELTPCRKSRLSLSFVAAIFFLLGFIAPNFISLNYRISKSAFVKSTHISPPILHKLDAMNFGAQNPPVRDFMVSKPLVEEILAGIYYDWIESRWFAFYLAPAYSASKFFCKSYFDKNGNYFLKDSGCISYGK